MISVSGKNWEQKKTNQNLIEKLRQDNDFSEILSRLIISRKFDQTELNSINNELNLNNIFFKNDDFKKSVDLIIDTIGNKEMICILGDYDVDGSVATSLIVRVFENIKQPFFYYIPDREKDGYGASKKLFKRLILKKPKLVIMVDCGSTANEAINFLNKNNIKSLIIDHHEINKPFPKSNAIINPKKNNGYIEYDYLCATTLVYFFLDLLLKKINNTINISNYLIYVLLATVCDVMPIRKLNRLIAITALKKFDINKNIALKILFELNQKKNKLNIDDLSYLIGPILNAGGRLGRSSYATELLASDNLSIVSKKSEELIKLNNRRKEIEKLILDDINFKKIESKNKEVVIYYNQYINEGLIGIIASRLRDHFNKPSVVITVSGDFLKGSARSIHNYKIGRVIKNSIDKKITLSGGGHNMAAGFLLDKKKINEFENFLLKDYANTSAKLKKKFLYDAEISSLALNTDFYNEIKKLEPFGTGNQLPIFLLKDLRIIKPRVLNNKHISLILKSKTGFSIKSVSFNSINNKIGDYLLNYKNSLNVLGQINQNFWNNRNTLQLTITDIIL